MPRVGLKITLPVFLQQNTLHARDGAAALIGQILYYCDAEIKENETGERYDTPGEFSLCTTIVKSRYLWEI